ncbi:MAG: hypothetical protein ACOCY5_04020 [Desulfohalobiaceae bacterium]
MARREKILVILMALALLYGALELFILPGRTPGPEQQEPEAEAEQAQELVQSLSQNVEDSSLSQAQTRVLHSANRKWDRNPFYVYPESDFDASELVQETSEEELGTIHYTGYLEMGQKRMAIINGSEYQTGDRLEQSNALLLGITPEHVLLRAPSGGKERLIPYTDKDPAATPKDKEQSQEDTRQQEAENSRGRSPEIDSKKMFQIDKLDPESSGNQD